METVLNIDRFVQPTMLLLLIISFIAAIILAFFLNFHWREYGFGQPVVKILKYLFFVGIVVLLSLMLVSVGIYG